MGSRPLTRNLLSLTLATLQTATAASLPFVCETGDLHPAMKPLSPRESADSLRVFWWNIEKGITNKRLGTDALNANLMALVGAKMNPDVIVLGEFSHHAMLAETLRALRKEYREIFIPYNEATQDLGIAVFAKGKVEVLANESLDWTPQSSSVNERKRYRQRWIKQNAEAYYFGRNYTRIRVTHEGRVVNLIPMHLLMPWVMIRDQLPVLGSLAVGRAIVFGRDNPLIHQLARLVSALHEDFGPNLDREPIVLVGDLNVPRKVGPIQTHAYRTISANLSDAFRVSIPTFPTSSSSHKNKYPSMQLDHAFVSQGVSVKSSGVLPLKGSDHYPIFLDVLTQSPACDTNLAPGGLQ